MKLAGCPLLTLFFFIALHQSVLSQSSKIDRKALVDRNSPENTKAEPLSSLSVGNGEFAYTVDITGLQSFPNYYKEGVPLGTQSQWGWHSFIDTAGYRFDETLEYVDLGRGHQEPYPVLHPYDQRKKQAAEWFRMNAHRMHLGIVGFELGDDYNASDFSGIGQQLDLWDGIIRSKFNYKGQDVAVETVCHPEKDMMAASIHTDKPIGIKFHFPYPNAASIGDGCSWDMDDKHQTAIVELKAGEATLKRTIDTTVYYVRIAWQGRARLVEKQANYFVLQPDQGNFSFSCHFMQHLDKEPGQLFPEVSARARRNWNDFWTKGAAVDFSACTDIRAKELERRVVLSQYLLAIQCAGSTPPQETGLTYNSWYGKFHMEMVWWHQANFALWGHEDKLEKTFEWYGKVMPKARQVAVSMGLDGVRWMKMTDPSGTESPSQVGPFLIWQQPHFIYLAELFYRSHPTRQFLEQYSDMVEETAKFMASFVTYDKMHDRYILQGLIAAQEVFSPEKTRNTPFELSYWHFGLTVAQQWRERLGKERNPEWDRVIRKLSKLSEKDGLLLAAESAPDTYSNKQFTRDHMAVLGAYGILPKNNLFQEEEMRNTLHWILDHWQWDQTWGWDFPMTAMCAARLEEPENALRALLMDVRTNTYLLNGHNYQNKDLRIYLPGNGGLLTAISLMCAGWDGCKEKNPGFPKDGKWDVRWEGLKPMP